MKTSIVRHIFLYMFIFVTFVISGLLVNAAQCLLYFGLRPYSKYLYRKINYYLSYTFYCQMVCATEWFSDSELYIYVDKKDLIYFGKEHACVVLNHKYEIDWMFIGTFSEKVHVSGNFKAYMKKIIRYVPPLGWCLFFSENIFLERSFEKDKEIIQKQISEIVDFPDPIWIILFPEGTRFSQRKHEESVKLAQEKGLPILKHHLNPRPKGFLTSIPAFRGKMGALYDVTLSIQPNDEVKPTMLNVLLGKKVKAHFYIKRIPMEQVPEDEQKATELLNEIFARKDKLQDSFFNTGDYFAESGVERIEPFKLNGSYLTLLNTVGWMVVITVPLYYYFIKFLCSATIYSASYLILGITFFSFLCYKALDINKVKKGEPLKNKQRM